MALLALLAGSSSHALTRGKLVGLLWPEAPEKTARNRLTTCVHQLRSALGAEVLLTAGSTLQLDTRRLSTDLVRFHAALEAEDPGSAAALYQGPFLDGFWLPGSRDFEEWAERERSRLERLMGQALEELARSAAERGAPGEAVRWWRERAAHTPFDSRVALELAGALVRSGSPAEALRVARHHQETLRGELGVEPDPSFLEEVQHLTRAHRTETPDRPDIPDRREGPTHPPSPPPSQRSLAVLPFQVTGPSKEAHLLADGLHQDLVTELARIPDLIIISPGSVTGYRDPAIPASTLGRELGVAHLVRGSVQVLEDRFRLRVQLVDAARDSFLWANRYDRELTPRDFLEMQSDLARKIARTLQLQVTGEASPGRVLHSRDLEAYRLYARGRAFMAARSRAPMWRAVECFEEAIRVDSSYALAWAGLGDALVLLGDYHLEEPEVVRHRGEAAVRRALELDPELAEAHATLGNLLSWQRQLGGAIPAHREATRLRPGYAHAHQWLSWVHLLAGHPQEARAAGERAVTLDPFEAEAGANLATAILGTGDAGPALEEARRVLGHEPDFQYARFVEGMALWALGEWEEGSGSLVRLTDPWARDLPHLARILAPAMTGEPRSAAVRLEELRDALPPFHLGLGLAALGRRDEALEALHRAPGLEWPETLLLRYHPRELTAAIRPAPDYAAFLNRVDESWGLEP